jgi:ketosteroid isomerase-like protein
VSDRDNANLATLEGVYARWHSTKGGNVEEVLDLFDDEIEMHSALSADVPDPIAGVHVRREEAAQYFEGLLRDWEMVSYDVDRFIVGTGGDEIVMVGRCAWRNKANGNVADIPKVDIHTFRNGKVVRFQEVYDTLGFARALGAVQDVPAPDS